MTINTNAAAPKPTYEELLALLVEARNLGLTFDIGRAYISRAYIDAQDDLVTRINAALKANP